MTPVLETVLTRPDPTRPDPTRPAGRVMIRENPCFFSYPKRRCFCSSSVTLVAICNSAPLVCVCVFVCVSPSTPMRLSYCSCCVDGGGFKRKRRCSGTAPCTLCTEVGAHFHRQDGGEGGCTQFGHGRSRMAIDPRIFTTPGRSTPGFHQPGRQRGVTLGG